VGICDKAFRHTSTVGIPDGGDLAVGSARD
jgi:hypothetical protein